MEVKVLNEIRRQKGLQIAQKFRIMKRQKGGYIVPSESGGGAYVVEYRKFKPLCECPDFEKRGILGVKCKHCWAVEFLLNKPNQIVPDVRVERKIYPQNWKAYNQAQTQEAELFMKLLHDLTDDISEPYVFGRPSLDLGEMVFCSALKVYSMLSSRRTTLNYQTALEKGFLSSKPHFNAVSKLLNKQSLTSVLLNMIEISSLPLKAIETNFAIDSSGFSTCRFDRWFNFKYGKEINSRIWLKAHLVCGTKTNIVTAVRITEAYSNDQKEFPELVQKTSKNFHIDELSADKGYLSYKNMKMIDDMGATAYIPFKTNSTARSQKKKLWKKMFHYFMLNREEFLQHYHKRSNVETTFHMIKSKFGSSLRSKNNIAQVNEILLKVLCHNICVIIQEMHELGIKPDFENLNRGNSNG